MISTRIIYHPISWIQAPEGFYDIDRNGTPHQSHPTGSFPDNFGPTTSSRERYRLTYTKNLIFRRGSSRADVIVENPAFPLNV